MATHPSAYLFFYLFPILCFFHSPVWPVPLNGNVQVALQAEEAGQVASIRLHMQARHLPQAPSLADEAVQPPQHLIPCPVVPGLGLQPLRKCSALGQIVYLPVYQSFNQSHICAL